MNHAQIMVVCLVSDMNHSMSCSSTEFFCRLVKVSSYVLQFYRIFLQVGYRLIMWIQFLFGYTNVRRLVNGICPSIKLLEQNESAQALDQFREMPQLIKAQSRDLMVVRSPGAQRAAD
ncbi:PREDICTED: uncharacterized protein LOC106294835 isoform X2 [Brassica oleracea var. oleracea]|uniref:uncharacterized protein LOC106294835 isoform X2 n=1 Tax=Brassica oleracea var. oleracea TaxID=109376 RepID=UPI0006A6CF81|nr:PREDICTED: uncharacterized protein LOC106294835 isoform X2 [Brassica oleracea var. oleracea]